MNDNEFLEWQKEWYQPESYADDTPRHLFPVTIDTWNTLRQHLEGRHVKVTKPWDFHKDIFGIDLARFTHTVHTVGEDHEFLMPIGKVREAEQDIRFSKWTDFERVQSGMRGTLVFSSPDRYNYGEAGGMRRVCHNIYFRPYYTWYKPYNLQQYDVTPLICLYAFNIVPTYHNPEKNILNEDHYIGVYRPVGSYFSLLPKTEEHDDAIEAWWNHRSELLAKFMEA